MRMHNRERREKKKKKNTSGRLVDPFIGGVYMNTSCVPLVYTAVIKGQLLSLSQKVRIIHIYTVC